MLLIELALCTAALAALIPALVLFTQVCFATLEPPTAADVRRHRIARPRVAVLIPAHDEASVIAPTVQGVLAQLAPHDRVVVVADNCTDSTAVLATAAGAEVVERHNLEQRGKSYAVEFGIRHLSHSPPEVVIVVDADCALADEALDRLARECQRTGRPIQALYLMKAQKAVGLAGNIAEFAWIVKNWVRPLGMRNLGLPVQLMGSGMAFPWAAIAQVRVGNAEMAEDYKLGIDLALLGHAPAFLPAAVVTSQFPLAPAAELSQRTRWEHGHLQLALRAAPRLFVRAIAARDWRLLGSALDLLVPPLALLGVVIALLLMIGLAAAILGVLMWPLLLVGLALVVYSSAIGLAWARWGRACLVSLSFREVIRYVLAKLPIYFRFIGRRQRVWIKTARDPDQSGEPLESKSSK